MCGIIAITGKNAGDAMIPAALQTLALRGPDDHGSMSFPRCTIAQTRLSIIDLSTGHQPMRDAKEAVAITFNGEIYNYRELRASLESLGHTFVTASDTEVILKAYIEYGEKCPEYLDGMFAFVIWDERSQELFMARDRFGEKPLFYAYDAAGILIIASEIKALFAAGIKGELDPAGIDLYLTLMYIPPWRTVYKNVHVLMPAHRALYANGKLEISRYWQLTYKPLAISYADAKEEVRRLFRKSVEARMLAADVEIGAFLSGGVDSTLVTAYAQKFVTHPIKTFALGYGDHINELPYAEEASKAIGTDHHTLQASSDLTHELEKIMAYFDEPHGDSADFPQHLISEMTAKSVKVALVGDGGDELFFGYGHYFSYWHTRKIVRLYNMLFSSQFGAHLRKVTVFPKRLRRSLWKKPGSFTPEPIDTLIKDFKGNDIQKINLFDLTTLLPGQLLTKVDQASMMHSLETRTPFLDHHLAEFVFNLPDAYKADRSTGKLILKDLLAEIMPRAFVDRKKQGLGAPVRMWLQELGMQAYIEKKLGIGARLFEFLREDSIAKLIQSAYTRQDPKAYYQLWVLLCLELWLGSHTDAHLS
jgi:asparagine synthase (glutamine-hydrolysing)